MARALFEIGEPKIGEIKLSGDRAETALFSDQFEGMSDAIDVAEASAPIIDAINGICFIHDSARAPLRRSRVHRRLLTGDWDSGTIFASAAQSLGMSRAVAFGQAIDKDGNVIIQQSRQSIWLQHAVKDERTLDVLAYIRGTPDWFILYKAYEAMKADGGGPATGWPDSSRFRQSANIRRHFSGHPSSRQIPGKPFVRWSCKKQPISFVRSRHYGWTQNCQT
jgi:hypothetical protein